MLVSDAECNAGSLWEAVMFAAHHDLANLVAIVDLNGQQALGYTSEEFCPLPPWPSAGRRSAGMSRSSTGTTWRGLTRTVASLDTRSGRPHVLVATTIFGKGVSFMEGKIKWHYWPMTDDEYRQALTEIGVGA